MPQEYHELVLKKIAQYLKSVGTHYCDLVFNPSRELKIECYPESDVSGMNGYENASDASCVKSNNGFVMSLLLPTVQTCGNILNCKLRQHFQLWKQRSLC